MGELHILPTPPTRVPNENEVELSAAIVRFVAENMDAPISRTPAFKALDAALVRWGSLRPEAFA